MPHVSLAFSRASFGGVAAEVALVDPSIGFVDVEVRELDGFARARGGLVRHLRERFRGGAGEFHRRALRLELGGARGDEFSAQLAASAREVRVGHDGVRGRGGGVSVVGVARGARGAAGEEPGFVVVPPSAAEDVAARRFETCREGGDGAMSRRLERGGGGGDGAARGGARGAANLGGAERRAVLLAGHPAGGIAESESESESEADPSESAAGRSAASRARCASAASAAKSRPPVCALRISAKSASMSIARVEGG